MAQPQILQTLSNALVFPNPETLARVLADDLVQHIRTAVAARGVCHCVFPGGRSPRRVLELLREQDLPWKALHLYPSDERCVPLGDSERNDRLIAELFLGQVPLPPTHLHSIPAELGPEEGATWFSQLLAQTPPFDIALLGVGPDGHTASLFPATRRWQMSAPSCRCGTPQNRRWSGSPLALGAFWPHGAASWW